MILAQIRRYRAWAKSCTPGNRQFVEVISELCDEVERLHGVNDERHGDYTNYTLMPWGVHKGKELGDMPADYFEHLQRRHPDRGVIQLEIDHSNFQKSRLAEQILKLLDYAARRFGDNSDEQQNYE